MALSSTLNGARSAATAVGQDHGSSISAGRRIELVGGVQGLGVRPAIYRLASNLGIGGSVCNTPRGVTIEIEGPPTKLDAFEQMLEPALPAAANLVRVASTAIPLKARTDFTIVREPSIGPLTTRVPQDRGLCPDCSQETATPGNRRAQYPFTSCTQCGPRYTVIRTMPFERADTAMAEFPLCADCRREYERPGDRRFHAQTTACPACGPEIWCTTGGETLRGPQAIQATVRCLKAGKIVAIRGLGGYQLLVDATKQTAVERLREHKGRRAKPLAVMAESLEAARRLADIDHYEAEAFEDPSAPIVLLSARVKNGLAAAIHPHLDTVGLMRPTTPLHAIIAHDFGRPLVCTSANREGDPIEFCSEDAERHLAGVADLWLHHNRAIIRPIDDSVVRVIAGRRVTIRLGRGLAPLPLDLPAMQPTIAVGGFLKGAAAWSNGTQAVLGPHIGDQESLASRQRYLSHLKDWLRLYRIRPAQLVHDMHPEYFSTLWAQKQSLPKVAIQHHHAHVVAGMLEQGWLDRQVLGVAWDGTGYGTDGTIWGGEFLVSTARDFERVARLRPFSLPGGEAAIHEPWRIAVSVCGQLDAPVNLSLWPGWNVDARKITSVAQIVSRPQLSPVTSSAGRLIDAAAALILGIDLTDFDGQAAMRLEAAADRDARGWYHFPLSDEALPELDWRPLFAGLLDDHRHGVDVSVMATRFHRSLAHGIVSVCRHWNELPIVLSGGVFQNRLLTELVAEMIGNTSQPLGLPGIIPPNDGGLAAGQLAIAAARGMDASCV